jgi:poly-beta-1,6-N-acetyl-D-glucosamine synthase
VELFSFIKAAVEIVVKDINLYVFWYPLVMSIIWIIGGTLFHIRREKKPFREINEFPFVSILVPCYNEQDTISETVVRLNRLNYPQYEIIAINDGSKDNTRSVLRNLSEEISKLRVINCKNNSGKANALYVGLLASKGELIMCLDADSYLDPDALNYIIPHFTAPHYGERVGAVTGNPRIRNRSSLLARIQLCEYASIIGLIKRSQRLLGKVMTVSGVTVAFRKRALLDCKLWDRDLITEDIGVTWKLQKRFWDVRYEPKAICWMLVPETLSGLWKQRVRWAQGGIEVILRHWDVFFDWRYRRLIPVYLEQVLSLLWVLSWVVTTFYSVVLMIYSHHYYQPIRWNGAYLGLICLIQIGISMAIEKKYDESFLKYYLWAAWYPIFYWYFNAIVVLRAIPKALVRLSKRQKNRFAIWESPDRGLAAPEVKDHNTIFNDNTAAALSIDRQEFNTFKPSPHIIDGRQKKLAYKALETTTTIAGWLYLFTVFMQFVFSIGLWGFHIQVLGKFLFIDNMQSTIHTTVIVTIIVFAAFLWFFVWGLYNARKYGSLRRRKFPEKVGVEELKSHFLVTDFTITKLQNAKYVEINASLNVSRKFK